MRLVYMINVDTSDTGYLCKIPLFVARMIDNKIRSYGWSHNPWGEGDNPSQFFTEYEIQQSCRWVGFRRMVGIALDRWGL